MTLTKTATIAQKSLRFTNIFSWFIQMALKKAWGSYVRQFRQFKRMRLKSSGYGSKFWQYNGIIHSRSRFLSYSSMALKKAWGFVIILLICRLHATIVVATIVGTLEAKSTESSDATMNLMSEWQGPKSLMRRSSAHFLRALDGAGFLIKWNLMVRRIWGERAYLANFFHTNLRPFSRPY